jgi:hypothetical protein
MLLCVYICGKLTVVTVTLEASGPPQPRGSTRGARLWMGSESKGPSTEPWRQNPTTGFGTGSDGASTSSAAFGKLELVQKAFMAPFNHKKSDSTRIFSDRT